MSRNPRTNPRRGDTWKGELKLITVINGKLQGRVVYSYRFAGDPAVVGRCRPEDWPNKVRGMTFKGAE